MKHLVVCGSIAIDTILLHQGSFATHIQPDKIHKLNVAFTTSGLREEYGGTGANIAYGLARLGDTPHLVGAIGQADASRFETRFQALGVATEALLRVPGARTPQAFILTDLNNNQITGFYPGAMELAHETDLRAAWDAAAVETPPWAIVAPDSREAMRAHSRTLSLLGAPYLFDPGQAMTLLDGEDLRACMTPARGAIVNDYEMGLLEDRTGWGRAQWGSHFAQAGGALIVTLGGEGCEIWQGASPEKVPVARATVLVDPTGCGDAFRAGLLHGLARDWSWSDAARMGAAMGAIQIAHPGAQNYHVSREEVIALAEASYPGWVPPFTLTRRPTP